MYNLVEVSIANIWKSSAKIICISVWKKATEPDNSMSNKSFSHSIYFLKTDFLI